MTSGLCLKTSTLQDYNLQREIMMTESQQTALPDISLLEIQAVAFTCNQAASENDLALVTAAARLLVQLVTDKEAGK